MVVVHSYCDGAFDAYAGAVAGFVRFAVLEGGAGEVFHAGGAEEEEGGTGVAPVVAFVLFVPEVVVWVVGGEVRRAL